MKVIVILLSTISAFSQQSYRTRLLANLNNHHVNQMWSYSACWGYIAPNGREYAILGCYTGTSFIDITDTNNIVEVDFLPSPSPLNDVKNAWREMKCYSHYCYIVSEADTSGIQIVDLQYLPDSIHYVKKYSYSGHERTHTISQAGHYLYLNGVVPGLSGMVIIDINDPENPVKRGEWRELVVHDSRIVNDYIYACNILDGTVSIIDASDKDLPQTITSFYNNPSPSPHNCALSSDGKYILVTDELGSLPRMLKIWDITDINNVTFVSSWQPTNITTSIIHNVEVYDKFAVIAHYTAGIRVVDISSPFNPTEVAWYDSYPQNDSNIFEGCWGVFMFPSKKIIGSDMQTGLYVIKTDGVFNNQNNTVQDYSLSQNYPNPFNSTSIIKYSIGKSGFVKLTIYDVLGNEVRKLVNSHQEPTEYSIEFDASNLASGIYFCNITSDTYSKTIKLILLR